ncbi:hypothetical protein FB45DRAFT_918470 [Roridomyces roridus]|uniref:DUF6533 domain-containing protein n=1 Tax=Roridomyces roridus TaxID=1738132 RepID=A0AAD7BRD7_9AGAR|nr:hypothetical protein FB45DRAFT_918470 [Roridomyces roridus]
MATSLPALYDGQILAYITVAAFALLVYDSCLTMGQEYQYIWRSKNGPIKALYVITRYSTFITSLMALETHFSWGEHSPATCRALLRFTTVFTGFGIGVTEVILFIRTYALCGRPKKLIVLFVVLWVVIGGLNIWGLVKWSQTLSIDSEPFTKCNLEDSSNFILVCYGSRLVGETIIAALTISKYWPIAWPLARSSPLVATFYQDGILWYLAMVSVLVINVVLQSVARPSLKFLAEAPMRVLHAVLACRLVLHVRVTADEEPTVQSWPWHESESSRSTCI